ncbi:MAG: glycosyltransferase family 87 protein [Candidatus Limnocylindrales bacterium]
MTRGSTSSAVTSARLRLGSLRTALGRLETSGALPAALLAAGLVYALIRPPDAYDAHAYWAMDPSDPYRNASAGRADAFLYSPVWVQAFSPLTHLPFPVFIAGWTFLLFATLVWLARGWTVALLLVPAIASEVGSGNIHLLLAAAIVLGFRWPWTWSLVLLTKVTPGVGLLWFVVRREWRELAIALGATAALAGISFIVAPGLWGQWLDVLRSNSGSGGATDFGLTPSAILIPLAIRLPVAAAIVVWGARTSRRWTVPVSAFVALPVLWILGTSLLVGVLPLLREARAGGGRGRAAGAADGRGRSNAG